MLDHELAAGKCEGMDVFRLEGLFQTVGGAVFGLAVERVFRKGHHGAGFRMRAIDIEKRWLHGVNASKSLAEKALVSSAERGSAVPKPQTGPGQLGSPSLRAMT